MFAEAVKINAMKTVLGVLGVVAAALVGSLRAAEFPTAAEVIREAGVSAGLVVVVGTTDGALEADLTRGQGKCVQVREEKQPWQTSLVTAAPATGGRMLVQGLALSDDAAAKAREHIFGQKLYGLASVSEVSSVKELPYYDRLVNVLVADLDALGKGAPAKEEIDRVLGYEGVAYLKQGGKWSKTVLRTPPEIDSWTHYHYDATGNPVSKDRVAGPPNAFRWIDGPLKMNLIGGFRTSDGVAVQINHPWQPTVRTGNDFETLRLWARDVSSGVLLWHRPVLPAGARYSYAGTYTETFVAAGGRVYIYDFTDANRVALTALNLRTGATETVFDQGVVCRKADAPAAPADPKGREPDWREWASDFFAWSMVLVHDGKVVQMVQDSLLVMDAATGNVLWRQQAADGMHYLKALVTGGRLVALTAKVEYGARGGGPAGGFRGRKADLVAAEAWRWKDGTPLWRTELGGLPHQMGHEALFHQGFGAQEPYILLPHDKGLRLMSAKDGSTIWENAVRGMIGYHIIGDRIWLGHGGTHVFGGVLMLATGERDPTPRSGGTNQSACDAPTATVNWFMGKRNFVPVDRPDGWPHWVSMRCFGKKCGDRAACSYGSVFGVMDPCGCDQFIRGSCACYAVRPVQPVADDRRVTKTGASALAGALERQVEALKGPAAAFWVKPENLPAYWYTGQFRSERDIAYWPAYGQIKTEAVTVGDLALAASINEHRLTATRDGREVWNFIAGGRIPAPPVIHGDLAIFPCHDGHVYAVRLKDGSLAWRFLAAPADKRHVVLGQVESAWPVFGVVHDFDRLYCSAGRQEELDGGIHFYCLDAATGAAKWHVSRRRGMESSLDEYRRRKNHTANWVEEDASKGVFTPWVLAQLRAGKKIDGRAQLNDPLELRDGRLWLHGMPMVDVANPKDDVVYPRTLVPPQLMK